MKRTRETHCLIEAATSILAWDFYQEESYREAREYIAAQRILNPTSAEDRAMNTLIDAICAHWEALERLPR